MKEEGRAVKKAAESRATEIAALARDFAPYSRSISKRIRQRPPDPYGYRYQPEVGDPRNLEKTPLRLISPPNLWDERLMKALWSPYDGKSILMPLSGLSDAVPDLDPANPTQEATTYFTELGQALVREDVSLAFAWEPSRVGSDEIETVWLPLWFAIDRRRFPLRKARTNRLELLQDRFQGGRFKVVRRRALEQPESVNGLNQDEVGIFVREPTAPALSWVAFPLHSNPASCYRPKKPLLRRAAADSLISNRSTYAVWRPRSSGIFGVGPFDREDLVCEYKPPSALTGIPVDGTTPESRAFWLDVAKQENDAREKEPGV